mgnify:CR=1 FL=1
MREGFPHQGLSVDRVVHQNHEIEKFTRHGGAGYLQVKKITVFSTPAGCPAGTAERCGEDSRQKTPDCGETTLTGFGARRHHFFNQY